MVCRGDDGTKGSSVVASMQDAVDEGLVKFTTEIIDELVSPIGEDVELEETLKPCSRLFRVICPSCDFHLDRLASRDVGKGLLASAQYITSGCA